MGCVRKFTDEYLIVIGQGNLVQGAGKPNPYRWHLGALELGSAVPALPNLLVVKCQQNPITWVTLIHKKENKMYSIGLSMKLLPGSYAGYKEATITFGPKLQKVWQTTM